MDSWPGGLGSRLTAVTSRVQILAGGSADEITKKVETTIHVCLGAFAHHKVRLQPVVHVLTTAITRYD